MTSKTLGLCLFSTLTLALTLVMVTVFVLLPAKNDIPLISGEDLELSGEVSTECYLTKNPVTQNDTVVGYVDNNTSGTYSYLTASPVKGWNFAYWKYEGSSITAKVSGDKCIKVPSENNGCFTPVFISDANKILIYTATNLASHLNETGKLLVLQNDITLDAYVPGSFSDSVLDGNNKKIFNLNVTNSNGLFTSLSNAVIKDLIISSGSINSNKQYVGSFAGSVSSSLLSRCVSYMSINNSNSNGCTGGVIGQSSDSSTKSVLFCSGFYGSIYSKTADALIGNKGTKCYTIRCFSSGAVKSA